MAKPDLQWNSATETLVKRIGEQSQSYQWLHRRSEDIYNYWNNFLAIPAIVLSTITGAGSIGFGNSGEDANLILGSFSIAVSIISTLNSYFGYAKRAESHRITAIHYSKLNLQISIELSLPRERRMLVKDFLKGISEQIMRLNEVSPNISDVVIEDYKKRFVNEPTTISKPSIVNGLEEIKIYLESVEGNVLIHPIEERRG